MQEMAGGISSMRTWEPACLAKSFFWGGRARQTEYSSRTAAQWHDEHSRPHSNLASPMGEVMGGCG